MYNVAFATLVFAALTVMLVAALYRLWVAAVGARAKSEAHRGTAEALRCAAS